MNPLLGPGGLHDGCFTLSWPHNKPYHNKTVKTKTVNFSDDDLEVLDSQLPRSKKTSNSPRAAARQSQDVDRLMSIITKTTCNDKQKEGSTILYYAPHLNISPARTILDSENAKEIYNAGLVSETNIQPTGYYSVYPTIQSPLTALNAVIIEDHVLQKARAPDPGAPDILKDTITLKVPINHAATPDHQGQNTNHVWSEEQNRLVELPGSWKKERRVNIYNFPT